MSSSYDNPLASKENKFEKMRRSLANFSDEPNKHKPIQDPMSYIKELEQRIENSRVAVDGVNHLKDRMKRVEITVSTLDEKMNIIKDNFTALLNTLEEQVRP
jgi:archaellum component FlaC